MKKISSVILSFTLALGLLPAAASAKPSILPNQSVGKIIQQATELASEQYTAIPLVLPSDLPSALPSIVESLSEERVIVTFKSRPDKGLIERAKGRVNQEFQNIPALAISIPAAAIQGLKHNPSVESIELDQLVYTEQTQDWGIPKTKASSSWTSGYTGRGVKIAVIDTGIASHEDLAIAGGASVVSYTSSYADDNGHGTHVAGIIGALNNGIGTVGIAPDASLYAVKSLDQNGSGYLSDVVAGIDWSITNQMNIVNLSLGTTSDSISLRQIVDKAYAQGILVVAAAGNNGTSDGSGDTVNYPARYDSAIAVAATDSTDQRGSFSATGDTIEVAAPGVNVLSTYTGNRYVKMSGTSMAAPYVAGDLALLKQAYPTLTHVELRTKLTGSVRDIGAAGHDNWFGYGLIQAPQSAATEPTPSPAPTPAPTLEMMTSLMTSKSSYRSGETVAISAKVSDSVDSVLKGVTVSLTVTNPKGEIAKAQATTSSNGTASFSLPTTKSSVKGTYQVKATVSLSNYTSSSASTLFQLK